MPPIKPSQVFFGLILGITLCLPNSLPQVYCATSLNCVRNTKYNIKPAPPPAGFLSSGNTNKNAIWLRLNTVVIMPQCKEPMARKKPSVSPMMTMRKGSSKNMYTGIKMMNMPYQPMPTQ